MGFLFSGNFVYRFYNIVVAVSPYMGRYAFCTSAVGHIIGLPPGSPFIHVGEYSEYSENGGQNGGHHQNKETI
jgi:hypothetical protein